MTYNITLTANHQSLTAEYLPLAAESVQYLTAKVVCETEDWTGREIKAMFGQGCTVHEITVTGGEITAKQQLNLTAGDWCVWLVGNSARDGEVIPRITTNIAHISVAPTGGTEGNPFPTIPPTAEEQLRADMGNLADLTTEDKSSLVAAINEAAESGGAADAVTYTPQTLTTEQQKQARENITVAKSYQIPTTTINDNEVRVDGWAAVSIGVGRPSGFSIILSDVLNGALPFFVANDTLFLCTGVDNSGAYKQLTFVGFTSSSLSLTTIAYKNARWQDGEKRIYIYAGSVSPDDIDYRAKVAYYRVGAYGYIYGPSYNELMEESDFARKYPLAVVDGKFDNAVLPLIKVDDVDKSIIYMRTDVLVTGELQVRGLRIKDEQPLQIVDNITPPLYVKPASGIPKTDLADDVQTSLAKADTAISLGLTSATPGQIIKVKAVRDGKPTEWEAVDMPLGGSETWEKLYDGTIQIEQETMLIEVDIPRSDSAKEFQVYLHFAKNVAQEWDSKKEVKVYVNGSELGYFIIANKLASDYYFFAKRVFDPVGRVEFISADAVNPNYNVLHVLAQLQNGQGYEQKNTGEIRISFAAAYAGSIELLVYGRY